MKWGVWSPRDRSGLTGGGSNPMRSLWRNEHSLWLHKIEKETDIHCGVYIYLSSHRSLSIPSATGCVSLLWLQLLWATHSKNGSPKSKLFVQKFPWETLGFTPSLCCTFKCRSSFIRYSQKVSAFRRKIRASEMKTLRCQLYVAVSLSGLPVVLWSWQHATVFDSWGTLTVCRLAKGPLVSEVRSEETGPEKQASSWEKIRRDTNFSESHCEVHSARWIP